MKCSSILVNVLISVHVRFTAFVISFLFKKRIVLTVICIIGNLYFFISQQNLSNQIHSEVLKTEYQKNGTQKIICGFIFGDIYITVHEIVFVFNLLSNYIA